MKLIPGQRVRRYRELRGIPIAELASRLDMYPSALSRIENGKQPIKHHVLLRLSEELAVSVSELLGVDDVAPRTGTGSTEAA